MFVDVTPSAYVQKTKAKRFQLPKYSPDCNIDFDIKDVDRQTTKIKWGPICEPQTTPKGKNRIFIFCVNRIFFLCKLHFFLFKDLIFFFF